MESASNLWLPLSVVLAFICCIGIVRLNLVLRRNALQKNELAQELAYATENILSLQHRAMLTDLHEGLLRQSDRIVSAHTENAERQRVMIAEELRGDRQILQDGLRAASMQLTSHIESLTRTLNERLEGISGIVHQRLDEGFKKTNETFANVMARLATIDEAQKKIGDLTTNVVSLQELLGDKKTRGAFGEVQLEALLRNALPPDAFSLQHSLSNGYRVDCLIRLPAPTGQIGVDAKFPLENYERMFGECSELERKAAQNAFRADIKRHVDAIASKYIVANETADGAVMFVPAEAVFAEIHAYHSEVVGYAQTRRVWIVSPTTLMAILNTARAVLKDVETRKQIHLIKDALGKLAKDFSRFDDRMQKLATHIRQANDDVQDVHTSSKKISSHFARIEAVELDEMLTQLAGPLKTENSEIE